MPRGRTSAGLRCGRAQTAGAGRGDGQRRRRADVGYCSRRSGGLVGPNSRAAGRRARQKGQRAQPTTAEGGPIQTRGEPKEPQSTLESPTGLGESRAEEPGGENSAGGKAITRKIGSPLGAPKLPRAARAHAPGKASKIKKTLQRGHHNTALHARKGFRPGGSATDREKSPPPVRRG